MAAPKGLFYFPKVIPEELCEKLTKWFEETSAWKPITTHPNSREVMHFGYSYNYSSGNVTEPAPPIPDDLRKLIEIIADHIELPKEGYTFDQCIINKYENSQGISPHIDRQPDYGPIIACFTIGSGAILEFTRFGHEKYSIYTEPGSLYIMSDESRSMWKHSMPGRLKDPGYGNRGTRYSITFRSVVKNPPS